MSFSDLFVAASRGDQFLGGASPFASFVGLHFYQLLSYLLSC